MHYKIVTTCNLNANLTLFIVSISWNIFKLIKDIYDDIRVCIEILDLDINTPNNSISNSILNLVNQSSENEISISLDSIISLAFCNKLSLHSSTADLLINSKFA